MLGPAPGIEPAAERSNHMRLFWILRICARMHPPAQKRELEDFADTLEAFFQSRGIQSAIPWADNPRDTRPGGVNS